MTPEQIKQNIKTRQDVNEVLGLAEEACNNGLNPNKFWTLLAEAAAEKIGKVVCDPDVKEMSNEEAQVFELVRMPYGKYEGLNILQILNTDPEYLVWIKENEFAVRLGRYLRSQHYKSRLFAKG